MNVHELQDALTHPQDMLLLDIREQTELDEAPYMIPGSIHMPMGQVFVENSKGNLPKDKKIVMICRSGARCSLVAQALADKGYDLDYLEGGITAWDTQHTDTLPV